MNEARPEDRDRLAPFATALGDRCRAEHDAFAPVPDVVDVLDRAETLQRDAVPIGLRDGLKDLASVVPIVRPSSEGTDADREALAPFAEALRRVRERELEQRALSGIPLPPPRSSSRRVATAGIIMAAAALVVGMLSLRGEAMSEEERSHGSQAERTVEARKTQTPGEHEAWRAREVSDAIEDADGNEDPDVPATANVEIDGHVDGDENANADAREEKDPDENRARRRRAKRSRAEPADWYATMEARAREAWKRGDLAEAESLFRRIIRRAGRGRHAELAYGDLFALVRQRRGTKGQTELWREYLGRFPRGRFAEDARAGLCRRAKEDDRRACWSDYLRTHPSGAHGVEARAAVEDHAR